MASSHRLENPSIRRNMICGVEGSRAKSYESLPTLSRTQISPVILRMEPPGSANAAICMAKL